jgi:hypothetical protein
LGHTLTKLKAHVDGIEDSETKGWAIGNCPELAQVVDSTTDYGFLAWEIDNLLFFFTKRITVKLIN